MINSIVLVGRMVRDPEMRTTQTGKSVVSFSVAVQKRANEDSMFFRVSAWGQTAEYVSNYLGKGRLVAINGRLESRKYNDAQGAQKEIVEIVADNVEGLDRPKDDSPRQSGGVRRSSAPTSNEVDPFA